MFFTHTFSVVLLSISISVFNNVNQLFIWMELFDDFNHLVSFVFHCGCLNDLCCYVWDVQVYCFWLGIWVFYWYSVVLCVKVLGFVLRGLRRLYSRLDESFLRRRGGSNSPPVLRLCWLHFHFVTIFRFLFRFTVISTNKMLTDASNRRQFVFIPFLKLLD